MAAALILALGAVLASLVWPAPALATTQIIMWENYGMTDEAAIASGSSFTDTSGFVVLTITWSVTTDGGSFVPYDGADFLSYEGTLLGNQTGSVQLGFDNGNDDPDDYVTVVLTFSQSVTQLNLSLLDVDTGTWDDGVEIFYNGANNVLGDPSVTVTLGSVVVPDDETYMAGYEGNGGAANNETTGNIVLNFGSNSVSTIRIRYLCTDDASADPGGQRIAISDLQFDVPVDYGDAPDTGAGTGVGNYQTLRSDNGPRHLLVGYNPSARTTSLMLGATVDDDADGQPNAGATGDDLADVDDENLVTAFPALDTSAATYTIPAANVPVVNTTGLAATVYGYIDFNRDGDFADAGESTTAAVPNGATNPSGSLAWTGFATPLTAGATFARFRISTQGGLTSTGPAQDGEVEDHALTIATPTATPTASSTPTPTDTATPTATSTATQSPTPTASDTPTPACLNDSYEPDNTYLEAEVIPSDGSQQYHINTNPTSEEDWVTFNAVAGHTYEIRTRLISDINSSDPAANDTMLYLYDTDGSTLLAFNDDLGYTTWYLGYYYYRESLITWTAPAGGWYFVRELQWGPTAGYPIRDCHDYWLWVQDTTPSTPTPTDTATPIATDTATPTPTDTATPTPTDTATPTATDTATATPTDTSTPTPTDTATATPTDTSTPTPTDTATPTPTDTSTPTPTDTSTSTPTFTPTSTATVAVIDPAVAKSGDPASASVGEVVTFTLMVGNNGDADAENVVVVDTLPAFLDITGVAVSPLGPSVTIGTNTVTIGFDTLSPGEDYIVTISTVVNGLASPPGGTNIAELTTDSADDNLDNNEDSATIAIVALGEPEAPGTGFTPGSLTVLPPAPKDQPYVSYGDLWLEIPALGVETPILGVPRSRAGWEVTWLWDQAGYLNGTAFPTWSGNSVITAHVTLPDGTEGPFAGLEALRYGDLVVIHGWGLRHIYEIREVDVVAADDPSIFRHEERPWVTLLTCYDYDERLGAYRLRVTAHAVLLAIEQEGTASELNYDASGLPVRSSLPKAQSGLGSR